MDRSPLVVDEHMVPEHLGTILLSDESRYIFDGFIVTREGAYLGIGTGYGLVKRLTDRRQAMLFHMAHHDALTDLPNRQLFRDRLSQAVNAARRRQELVAVLYPHPPVQVHQRHAWPRARRSTLEVDR